MPWWWIVRTMVVGDCGAMAAVLLLADAGVSDGGISKDAIVCVECVDD